MELDEAEAAKEWGIPWHEWIETPHESRCKMVATVMARNILDAMRQHDYHKDAEREREAARKRKGKK